MDDRRATPFCDLMINTENIKAVVVYVKILSITLEFWNDKGLSLLASSLGKSLHLDSVTKDGIRLEFAKVCIEMNMDENFPDFIDVVLLNRVCIKLKVEYS